MLQSVSEDQVKFLKTQSSYLMTSFYDYLLNSGDKFKNEGLTPIYMLDGESGEYIVTSYERLNKTFH